MVSINFISPITNSLKSAYNRIPSAVVTKNSIINRVADIGKNWTSPHQRAILGATAILIQPFIDRKNKYVDDETRKVSVAKTCAKILVGTTTGIAMRYGFIKGVSALSKPLNEIPKNISPFKKNLMSILTPENLEPGNKEALKQYRYTMGTLSALLAMVFTNFLIDAPLTKFLTNKFISYQKKGDNK